MIVEDEWQTELDISFGDLHGDKAAAGREVWPIVGMGLVDPKSERELELRFDEPISKLIGFTASAVCDATDGDRSWAVPVTWYYRRADEQLERETSSLIYRPVEGERGIVAIDLVRVHDEVAPAGGKGRFEETVKLDSHLPIDPVPVSVTEQLSALAEAGRETMAFYRDHGTDPSTVRGSLPELVRDVELALDAAKEGSGPVFDTSFDRLEELIHPTEGEDIGPLESEWLREYALKHDRIEPLIRKRVSNHSPERAGDLYYALLARGDEVYADRTLSVLTQSPDEKALHALLMCLWYDNPERVPRTLDSLGTLLETKEAFTENDQGFDQQKVLREIQTLIDSSDHPEIQIAAIETLAALDPADPTLIEDDDRIELLRGVLEDLDQNQAVRDVAHAALERLNS